MEGECPPEFPLPTSPGAPPDSGITYLLEDAALADADLFGIEARMLIVDQCPEFARKVPAVLQTAGVGAIDGDRVAAVIIGGRSDDLGQIFPVVSFLTAPVLRDGRKFLEASATGDGSFKEPIEPVPSVVLAPGVYHTYTLRTVRGQRAELFVDGSPVAVLIADYGALPTLDDFGGVFPLGGVAVSGAAFAFHSNHMETAWTEVSVLSCSATSAGIATLAAVDTATIMNAFIPATIAKKVNKHLTGRGGATSKFIAGGNFLDAGNVCGAVEKFGAGGRSVDDGFVQFTNFCPDGATCTTVPSGGGGGRGGAGGASVCGDFVCAGAETCACASDCGSCAPPGGITAPDNLGEITFGSFAVAGLQAENAIIDACTVDPTCDGCPPAPTVSAVEREDRDLEDGVADRVCVVADVPVAKLSLACEVGPGSTAVAATSGSLADGRFRSCATGAPLPPGCGDDGLVHWLVITPTGVTGLHGAPATIVRDITIHGGNDNDGSLDEVCITSGSALASVAYRVIDGGVVTFESTLDPASATVTTVPEGLRSCFTDVVLHNPLPPWEPGLLIDWRIVELEPIEDDVTTGAIPYCIVGTIPAVDLLAPEVTTDGEIVCVEGDELYDPDTGDSRVLLTGFHVPPPSLDCATVPTVDEFNPVETGCFCADGVAEDIFSDGGDVGDRVCFVVPPEVSSGTYEVIVQATSVDCPPTGCPGAGCGSDPRDLFVRDPHIVSRLEELVVEDNSEPECDSPPEIAFQTGGFAAAAAPSVGATACTVTGAAGDASCGNWPGTGYLGAANGADSLIQPHMPLFAGKELRMVRTECQEECVNECVTDPDPTECTDVCRYSSSGTCTDVASPLEASMNPAICGVERDGSGSQSFLDSLVDTVEGVVSCATTLCLAGEGFGGMMSLLFPDSVADDDDILGCSDAIHLADDNWNVGLVSATPVTLGGAEFGEVAWVHQNYRVGAPHVLEYEVRVLEVEVDGWWDSGDEFCDNPNDIYMKSRVSLGFGGSGRLPAPTRFPEDGSTWSIPCDGSESFPGGMVVGGESFLDQSTVPARPFIYVEFGLRESDPDDADDTVGFASETLFLDDFLSCSFSAGAPTQFTEVPTLCEDEQCDASGAPCLARRVVRTFTIEAPGDRWVVDCSTLGADAVARSMATSRVTFEVEVLWSKFGTPGFYLCVP